VIHFTKHAEEKFKILKEHIFRVVYKKENNNKIIITFYPGRVKKYEQ